MKNYAGRWWYSLCAWYLWQIAAGIQRKKMKLVSDISHRKTHQRILHTQQAERLEMFMRHEHELLLSRQKHVASQAAMAEAFSQRIMKSYIDDTTNEVEITEVK
jgi:hypothetical protein